MISLDRNWSLPPSDLLLSTNDAHVWRASLNVSALQIQNLKQTLSIDELKRAEKFYYRKDCEQFIVARGLLRAILSRYLNLEPDQLSFCYNPYGKPSLVTLSGKNKINFNLSHSHGLVLYAITRGREIGIDIEHIRPDLVNEEIVKRFFSYREITFLHALPANMRRKAFFKYWARKEAYIKAKGKGLSFPLNQFDVSLASEEPATLLCAKKALHKGIRLYIQDLFPGFGYAAAIAVEGNDWHLSYWQWQE